MKTLFRISVSEPCRQVSRSVFSVIAENETQAVAALKAGDARLEDHSIHSLDAVVSWDHVVIDSIETLPVPPGYFSDAACAQLTSFAMSLSNRLVAEIQKLAATGCIDPEAPDYDAVALLALTNVASTFEDGPEQEFWPQSQIG